MPTQFEVEVDFDSKNTAKAMGLKFKDEKWFGKGNVPKEISKRDESEAVLKDFVQRLEKKQHDVSDEDESCFEFSVPEECLCSEENQVHWNTLLHFKNWNALKAVSYIKEFGLPRNEKDRTKMFKYFVNAKVGEQYVVCYEDVLDYSDKFKKAYGFETVQNLQKKYKIYGHNFLASLNKTEIPNEVKMLFQFVFPLSIKTTIKERSSSYESCTELEYERA